VWRSFLEDVQASLLAEATAFRDANIVDVATYEELKDAIASGKWARGPWAGDLGCHACSNAPTGQPWECIDVQTGGSGSPPLVPMIPPCSCPSISRGAPPAASPAHAGSGAVTQAAMRTSGKSRMTPAQRYGAFPLSSPHLSVPACSPATPRRKSLSLQSPIDSLAWSEVVCHSVRR
jgi:hypothetical protein